MNLLTDPLPRSVTIEGVDVPVRWDHRSCIRVCLAMLDTPDLDEEETVLGALIAFYPALPAAAGLEDAFFAMRDFLSGCPEPPLPGATAGSSKPAERAYSFLYDQEAIVSAFWQQYHIDLTTETLHWWVFRALLNGARDCYLADLMHMRTADEDGSSEQRKTIRERKRRWRLPTDGVQDSRANAIADALLRGSDGLGELLGTKKHN